LEEAGSSVLCRQRNRHTRGQHRIEVENRWAGALGRSGLPFSPREMHREQDGHKQILARVRDPYRPSSEIDRLIGEAGKHHDAVRKEHRSRMRGANVAEIVADRIRKILIGG
jgi:hypothetical protein